MLLSIFFIQFAISSNSPRRNIRRNAFFDNKLSCAICKQTVDEISQFVKSAKTEEEILKNINQLCSQYPSPYNAVCYSTLSKYSSFIIMWIEQGLKPTDICAKFNLCKSEDKNIVALKPFQSRSNSLGCDMCTATVDYIGKLLESQIVEAEIIVLVEQYCTRFESPYSTLCKSIVENSVPLIISYIEEGLVSFDICTKIGLCANESATFTSQKVVQRRPSLVPHHQKSDASPCTICTITINYIDDKMRDAQVEEEIIEALSSFCDIFGGLYTQVCKLIAHNYVPLIMKLIRDGVETLDICNQLGFCSQYQPQLPVATKQVQDKPKRPIKTIAPSNGLCEVCKEAIEMIMQLLEDQKIEEEIIQALKDFCKTLPPDVAPYCSQMAETYVPLVITLIESGIETLDICTTMKFCSTKQFRN